MKRKVWLLFLCAMVGTALLPVTARADTGPKPSVHIIFEGLGEELCYGTLLSETASTGPSSVWDGNEADARHNENENGHYRYANFDYATWKAFVEYEDPDGYYFLQEGWRVDETKELAWTYYPPEKFKILLYFPESEAFVSSGIYERYAFDSYFTVGMKEINMESVEYDEQQSSNERLVAWKSYHYKEEIISLICRTGITIALEFGIALLFGYRAKKQMLLVLGVNVCTQIVLNVLLNMVRISSGALAYVVGYVFFETVVFGLEAVVYWAFLPRFSSKKPRRWLTVVYALVANGVSFGMGFWIAGWMPGIF